MKITPLRVISRLKKDEDLTKVCGAYFQDKWFTSTRYGNNTYIPFDELWSYNGLERSWGFQHHCTKSPYSVLREWDECSKCLSNFIRQCS